MRPAPGAAAAGVGASATAANAAVATAQAQEPFYKGKRLTLLINFAAGGPTDIEGRLFAKYLVKHIDGAPTIQRFGPEDARSAIANWTDVPTS